jgi:hypothetical protein
VVDDEQWVADRVAAGTAEPMARMLSLFFQAARDGHFADVDPLLGRLLGREPRTVADLLAARIAT